MDFNWINLFGGIVVVIMLIPNVIYALKHKSAFSSDAPKALVVLEQISRYCCMTLMIIPLLVWKFGFSSVDFFIAYTAGNSLLLIIYISAWLFFFQKRTKVIAAFLCVTPLLIFILSGICLSHYLLVGFGILFGVCHMWISMKTFIPEEKREKKIKSCPYLISLILFVVLMVVLPIAHFFNSMSCFSDETVNNILFVSQFFTIPLLIVSALLLDRAIKINKEIDKKVDENA